MKKKYFIVAALILVAIGLYLNSPQQADDENIKTYTLTIKGHIFEPKELKVTANEPFKITVINNDPSPEEFESESLKIEKIIPGNSQATIKVRPVAPGTYDIFGEFNLSTAKGVLIAE